MHAARYARENPRIVRPVADAMVKTEPHLIQEISIGFVGVLVLLTEPVKAAVIDHTARGDALIARKSYDEAAAEYQKANALDKYDTYVTNRLGIAYLQLKKYYEAELQYRETLRLNPYFPEALNNLGFIQYSKGNFSGALDLYDQALAIQPSSATVYMNMAACYFSKAVNQALELDERLFQRGDASGTLVQGSQPNDPKMQFQLAKLLASRGDADGAISYLNKAVDAGFRDAAAIQNEEAFKAFNRDERFTQLLDRVRRR
jgi:Flp pilus assembly protein TadD